LAGSFVRKRRDRGPELNSPAARMLLASEANVSRRSASSASR